MRLMAIIDATRDNLEGLITGNDIILVDFWAPWCGPCRTMAPVLARAAAMLEPQVRILKLNTDAEPGVASRYGIRSIPTLIAFAQGREVARHSGVMPLKQFLAWAGAVVETTGA